MGNIKQRLEQGETLNGCWLNLGSPVTAEIVGRAGFDWVLIDLEHGAGTEKDVLHQLQALEHTHTAAVVRVESSERQRIHRVLDFGADGIMCPRVNDLAEAKQVVSGLRYPPDGGRGVAKMVRATGFGDDFSDYYENAKRRLLGIVQIETVKVLDHVEDIAALDGVDVLFIGPSDLSMELNIFGQFDHDRFRDALRLTVSAAEKARKAVGILLPDPDDYPTYRAMGIRMLACGSDATFVAAGARSMVSKLGDHRTSCANNAP